MATTDDRMIAALLRERESYLRTGRHERAVLVDEQLTHHGYVEPAKQPPQGRTAPPKQTADQPPGQTRPARKASQKAD